MPAIDNWQLVALKICDPAMGSAAFLVEACRQLGDELQIAGFHWAPTAQMHLLEADLKRQIETATAARRKILEARDDMAYEEHERALAVADEALDRLRLVGDLVVAAWFGAEKDKDREKLRKDYLTHVEQARGPTKDAHELRRWLEIVRDLRNAAKPIVPFHGGTIYAARKRYKWPGEAAVVVSVVHVFKGRLSDLYDLDGRKVPIITAFLFHTGGHDDATKLKSNDGKSFIGSYVLGMGFTFDDTGNPLEQTFVESIIDQV